MQRPAWEDIYLKALVAKATHSPDAGDFADRIKAITPSGHPAFQRVAQHFA